MPSNVVLKKKMFLDQKIPSERNVHVRNTHTTVRAAS